MFHIKLFLIAVLFVSSSIAFAAPLTGVYRGELYAHPNRINAYSTWLGTDVLLGQGHQAKDSWANIENPTWQLSSWGAWVKGKAGRRLSYAVAMFPSGQGNLAACANGDYNSHFVKLANNLVANGLKQTIIRPGWEFSGSWMPWYAGGGNERNYALCFQKIVTAMRTAQPSAGFQFDYNANYDANSTLVSNSYPGDAFVDFIGFDIYDQAWDGNYPIPSTCTGTCADTRRSTVWTKYQLPALTKFKNFAASRKKPLSIGEWGTDHAAVKGGGDNTLFVQNMLNFIFDPANNVGYHSYFDWQAGDGHHQLSDVDGSEGHSFVTEFPLAAARYKAFFAARNTLSFSASSIQAGPSPVARGSKLTIQAKLTATKAATVIVKFEIRDGADKIISTITISNQAFQAGVEKMVSAAYSVPTTLAVGTYRVHTFVLSSDFKKTYLYKKDATFSVK